MLSAERACIFRLVHRDNVPLILAHGVLSMNAAPVGLSYRSIGLDDLSLIDVRLASFLLRRAGRWQTMLHSTSRRARQWRIAS
jgi:hypothetical protein